jgi:ketosteroid isomerase-like protein
MAFRSVVALAVAAILGFAAGTTFGLGRRATGPAPAGVQRADSIVQVLTALQHRLAAALGARDVARLDTLISEDFLAINGAAKVLNKPEALAELANLGYDLLSVEDDSIHVRQFGPCAVVTARETIRARVQGREETGRLRLTNIWLEESGGWRTVGGQATILP